MSRSSFLVDLSKELMFNARLAATVGAQAQAMSVYNSAIMSKYKHVPLFESSNSIYTVAFFIRCEAL